MNATLATQFPQITFPTRKHEDWRYINLAPVLETPFCATSVTQVDDTLLAEIAPFLLDGATRAALINGWATTSLTIAGAAAPDGVTLAVHNVANGNNALQRPHDEQNAFVVLNEHTCSNVLRFSVSEQNVVQMPVQLLLVSRNAEADAHMSSPRVRIQLEAHATADVLISHINLCSRRNFSNTVVEVELAEGAQLSLTLDQHFSSESLEFLAVRINQAKESRITFTSITRGGNTTRNEIVAYMRGERAQCFLSGLSLLNGESQVYQHPTVNHLNREVLSRQLYKSIVNGDARSEVSTMSYVARNATLTDSAQMNRNMLLSDRARAIVRPQLKVLTDDVKAGHGATVGQVSAPELFYLRSRGIPLDEARALLISGFAEEVAEQIPAASIRAHVKQHIRTQLLHVVRNA